jgi:hypothetical protein
VEAPTGAEFDRLDEAFGLSPFDLMCVLICLAPEVDRRYERLYAYLQDDVTRRAPGVDLIIDLTCPSLPARMVARSRFSDRAPLIRHRLVTLRAHAEQLAVSLLDSAVRLDERIVRFLLEPDGGAPDAVLSRLTDRIPLTQNGNGVPHVPAAVRVVANHGSDSEGRRSFAAQLAHGQGKDLVLVDGERLRAAASSGTDPASVLVLALREARLAGAVLAWTEADELAEDLHLRALLGDLLGTRPATGLELIVTTRDPLIGELGDIPVLPVPAPSLTVAEREERWRSELSASGTPVDPELSYRTIAQTFGFSAGRIAAAARTTLWLAVTARPDDPRIEDGDVIAAARQHAHTRLGANAERITTLRDWDDLVLPGDRMQQLHEFADQVQHREQVHQDWGFGRQLGSSVGLNALFVGPPGTGKTMAAGVMARALGRELYRIDLSGMVSKYIGETEKNLARVFDEADDGNVILFFDEADALFGKRTAVKDAHDRYANIETSYLLQRLESHPGVVILATNLRKNMDEAFTRRLHVTIEFPTPDAADRLRIWTGLWPDAAPLSPGVDLAELAERVDLPGGSLRNIALASAFLAAAGDGVITMDQIEHATRREYQKLGKVLSTGDLAARSG